MEATPDDIGERIRAYRLAFAEEMEALSEVELNAPSWCDGWRTRDVLGHLVHLAESSQYSLIRDLIVGGVVPDRALAKKARNLGQRSAAELCERLRKAADGRFHMVGMPSVVGAGDVMVHGNDALRPIGREFRVNVEDVKPLLDIYRRRARMFFKRPAPQGVTLVAEDLTWSAGSGPEVRGSGIDLLLLLANRRQVIDRLSGPGLSILR